MMNFPVFDSLFFFLRIHQTKSQWIKITFSYEMMEKNHAAFGFLTVNPYTKVTCIGCHIRGCVCVLVSFTPHHWKSFSLLIQLEKEKMFSHEAFVVAWCCEGSKKHRSLCRSCFLPSFSCRSITGSKKNIRLMCTWLITADDDFWRALNESRRGKNTERW